MADRGNPISLWAGCNDLEAISVCTYNCLDISPFQYIEVATCVYGCATEGCSPGWNVSNRGKHLSYM